MTVAILKPSTSAGGLVDASSEIYRSASHTAVFYMKVVDFDLIAQVKPLDVTSETDSYQDIRHNAALGGLLRLTGYLPASVTGPGFDTLRNSTLNDQLTVKLLVGKYTNGGGTTSRYWTVKILMRSIQSSWKPTAVGIRLVMEGLITDNAKDSPSQVIEQGTS